MSATHAPYYPGVLWDIFCKVIDNHGDVGVCWRLAAELGARGEHVRLWVDEPSALAWMAPGGHPAVEVIHWTGATPALRQALPGDVIVEAFGCDPPPAFVAALRDRSARAGRQPPWINLEYLTAEAWAERSHGLESPVMSGPGQGLVKRFFFPGFTVKTGGLLREADLDARRAAFDRAAWLAERGIAGGACLVSLFCYEPAALADLLGQLAARAEPTTLLVTAGRAQAAVSGILGEAQQVGSLSLRALPYMSQRDYDHLLWACDFNFVRGEDSLVRAIWAARPFAWHAYPQDDGAHGPKIEALLEWLAAPEALRRFHRVWNGLSGEPLPALSPVEWTPTAELAAARARANPELASGLIRLAGRAATI